MGRPIAKLVSGDEQPRLLENPREWQRGWMAIAQGRWKVQNLSQKGELRIGSFTYQVQIRTNILLVLKSKRMAACLDGRSSGEVESSKSVSER